MANPKDMNAILTMEPLKLVGWLYETYYHPIPMPHTMEEFKQSAHILGTLSNSYSFLCCTHAAASAMVRDAKQKGKSKAEIDDCISRRDTLSDFMDALKKQYEAFSRMITVHQQANEELKMLREV